MPKAPKTLLDELARTLKARQNANLRFNRRVANTDMPNRYIKEADNLYKRLGYDAASSYSKIMDVDGGFSGAEKDEAFRIMPSSLESDRVDFLEWCERVGVEPSFEMYKDFLWTKNFRNQ